MVAKPLSERLDKPAVHKASSFEGHARAGVPHTSLTTSLASSLHHSLLTTAAPAPSMPSPPPLAPPLWPPATTCQQGSSWSHRCYCWMQMELMMA